MKKLILMDLSKALDTINQDFLRIKLKAYRFSKYVFSNSDDKKS